MDQSTNPWKIKSTKSIYENPWINVREDQVIHPSGRDGIYGVVSFKNLAIGIIPIDEEGNTWLVGQYRYPLNEYSWEIPMGGGRLDIAPIDSAKRELKEETGLTANRWNQLLKIHTSNSVTDETGYVFLAQDLQEGETEFEDTEVITVRKLPFNEVIEMVLKGEITDSLSIAGVLKAQLILSKKACLISQSSL